MKPLDEDRRYYWHAEYGLTDEDREIIRTRGIPMVDQERQLAYERVDRHEDIRWHAIQRKHWRKVRKLWNRLIPMGDSDEG